MIHFYDIKRFMLSGLLQRSTYRLHFKNTNISPLNDYSAVSMPSLGRMTEGNKNVEIFND